MLGLQAEAATYAAAELADSTAHKYGKYQGYWVRFMCRAGLRASVFSGEEAHLILYVTELARTCKYPTICSYLQGVKQFYIDSGRADPLRSDRAPPMVGFWRVMKGIQRLRSGLVLRKLPIERWMLLAFRQQLDLWGSLGTNTLHLAVLTAMVVGWNGMYRKSNICVTTAAVLPSDLRMLRRSDVILDRANDCLSVSTRFSKTNQRGDRVHTVTIAGDRGSPIDPVGLWIALGARVPDAPGGQHAFSYLDSRGRVTSLTADVFVAYTKRLATAVGLDSKEFSGHSYRRGGATSAFRAGIPGEMIQRIGDWTSAAYQAYIDVSPAQQLAASRRVQAFTAGLGAQV